MPVVCPLLYDDSHGRRNCQRGNASGRSAALSGRPETAQLVAAAFVPTRSARFWTSSTYVDAYKRNEVEAIIGLFVCDGNTVVFGCNATRRQEPADSSPAVDGGAGPPGTSRQVA